MAEKTIAEVLNDTYAIDYQMKAMELAKEQIFLQKYTPLIVDEKEEDYE